MVIQTVPSKENLSQPKHPSCYQERDLFIPGAQNTLSELPDDRNGRKRKNKEDTMGVSNRNAASVHSATFGVAIKIVGIWFSLVLVGLVGWLVVFSVL